MIRLSNGKSLQLDGSLAKKEKPYFVPNQQRLVRNALTVKSKHVEEEEK